MTRGIVFLTRNGQKQICSLSSEATPENLGVILTHFDKYVSDPFYLVWNATYAYEIDFDAKTVRGWHFNGDPKLRLVYALGIPLDQRIRQAKAVPSGWKLKPRTAQIRPEEYESCNQRFWQAHSNQIRSLCGRTPLTIEEIVPMLQTLTGRKNLFLGRELGQYSSIGGYSVRSIRAEGLELTDYSIIPWQEVQDAVAPLVLRAYNAYIDHWYN